MVQTSLLIAITTFLSVAVKVQAIPINVNIDARDEIILEARARRAGKIAAEIGKEVYTNVGNAVLHGGPSFAQQRPNRPGLVTPTFGASTNQPNTPTPRLSDRIPKAEPMRAPNSNPEQPSIGPVTAALREKLKSDKEQSSSAVKFDKKKVGKAKEDLGKPSPKVRVGGKPKAKEAPF